MFKFSNVCQSPERFRTQLLCDVSGKTPSNKKKKAQRLPVVGQQKFSFVGNPELLPWGCFLEATSPWLPGALVRSVKFS